jgi:hypothetical protein
MRSANLDMDVFPFQSGKIRSAESVGRIPAPSCLALSKLAESPIFPMHVSCTIISVASTAGETRATTTIAILPFAKFGSPFVAAVTFSQGKNQFHRVQDAQCNICSRYCDSKSLYAALAFKFHCFDFPTR